MSTQLSAGIVGLPNVGKSTLFNALMKKSAFAKASEVKKSSADQAKLRKERIISDRDEFGRLIRSSVYQKIVQMIQFAG